MNFVMTRLQRRMVSGIAKRTKAVPAVPAPCHVKWQPPAPRHDLSLPWNLHSNSGFQIPVELKQSSIPGAGLGRFAAAPVQAGDIIRADPILAVSDFIAMGGTIPGSDPLAIRLGDAHDLDSLVAFWSAVSAEAEVRKMMSWFIAGVPKARTDTGHPLSYILTHSLHANHAFNHNYIHLVHDDVLYRKAVRNIAVGEELHMNYGNSIIEDHIKTWIFEHGLTDINTLAERISAHEKATGAIP